MRAGHRFLVSCFLVSGALAGCGDVAGPPPGSTLRFGTSPEHVVAGRALPPVRVQVVDGGGRVLIEAAGRVELRLADGPSGATLVGETVRPVAAGTAVFSDLRVDRPARDVRLEARWVGGSRTALTGAFDAVEAPDLIRVLEGTAAPVGLLVDGRGARGFRNDIPLVSSSAEVEVILDRAAASNEAVAFQRGRAPMVRSPIPWTPDADTVEVRLPEPIRIPLTVWIVTGDVESLRPAVEAAAADAESIYDIEGAGIAFSEIEVVDATEDPEAETYAEVPFPEERDETDLFRNIGKREGRINLYGIRVVRFRGARVLGRASSGSDFTYIENERGWTGRTVAHELGHNLSLQHADELDGFDGAAGNLMAGGTALTEGQIFHMHFSWVSAMGRVYGLRTGEARRCFNGAVEQPGPECARLDLRLFPDAGAGAVLGSTPPQWISSSVSGRVRVGELVP